MPSVSEAQHRAMEAAAHGHSTLGIPEKVGKEFVAADWAGKLDAIVAGCDALAKRLDAAERKDAGDEPGNGEAPYGDVPYADPGYQPDGKKRYPIGTAEKIRSAWDYLHKAKDAERYTPAQRRQIAGRIVAAWKRKIDPKGPPEAR